MVTSLGGELEEMLDVGLEEARVRAWRILQLERITGNDELAADLEACGADWHEVEKARAGGATLRQLALIFGSLHGA